MVCFDYDGTLLSEAEGVTELPESVIESLEKLEKNGYLTVLATGRTMLVSQKITNYFSAFVAGNGGYVAVGDHVIENKTLADEEVLFLVEEAEKMGTIYLLDSQNHSYTNGLQTPRLQTFMDTFSIPEEWMEPWNGFEDEGISKIEMLYYNNKQKEQIIQTFGNRFYIADHPEDNYFDIGLSGITKGIGVEMLMEYLGLKEEDCYAFGDSDNDFEMFQAVGTGIAMKNHSIMLDHVTDMVTDGVSEDGIWNALMKLGLIS